VPFEPLEESEVRKLAFERLRRSLKNEGMVVIVTVATDGLKGS
jgi:hypothetical protein